MKSVTKTNTLDNIVEQTLNYKHKTDPDFNFATMQEPDANDIELSDLPIFIQQLQREGILPDNGSYVHYSIDNRTENNRESQCIVFNTMSKCIGSIKQSDLFVEHWSHMGLLYIGLREDYYRKLVHLLS